MSSPRPPRVSLYALGCKVNQYEMRQAAGELLSRGWQVAPWGEPVDLCIINTCAVTEEAGRKSRALLRRAARLGDDPEVLATGCYAEMEPEETAALPGVTAVAPNRLKPELADLAEDLLRRSGRLLFDLQPSPPMPEEKLVQLLGEARGSLARTRAVIKIQDGCNHFCSFCIIPFARGRLRSRPAAEVIAEAKRLADQGYKELVLTGICIGDYGDERRSPAAEQGRDPLALLLERLASLPGIERLRLSSVDPADVTSDLLNTMASLPQACRHLHLSLQAGSSRVLRAMRRRYDRPDFEKLLAEIYRRMPDAGLSADLIAGFPGETESDFQESLEVCRAARFHRIHAFPYSARPGAAAARLPDDTPPAEKARRVALLRSLAGEMSLQAARSLVGQTVELLVEGEAGRPGLQYGLTGGYLRVAFEGPESLRGTLVQVSVETAGAEGAGGRLA